MWVNRFLSVEQDPGNVDAVASTSDGPSSRTTFEVLFDIVQGNGPTNFLFHRKHTLEELEALILAPSTSDMQLNSLQTL